MPTEPALKEITPGRLSLLQRKWFLKQSDESQVSDIQRRFGLSDCAARLLATRDIATQNIENFLHPKLKNLLPDPYIFADMQKAVECVHDAIKSGESIVLYGDYDVDGGSSVAMLADYLKTIGHDNIQVYIPDRYAEGYGVNEASINLFHKQGQRLVITMDCGTASHAALARAKSHGMRVIVLDHHKPDSDVVEAYAFINPNRTSGRPPSRADNAQDDKVRLDYGHLAAVGVTFLFIVALNRHLREQGYFTSREKGENRESGKGGEGPDLWQFLDLVALGTVCDVVPLWGLNRAFVRHGLRVIEDNYKNAHKRYKNNRLGLHHLCKVSRLSEEVTAADLGFSLGPRLNAGSRMGESSLAARLLMADDADEACALSQRLDDLNKQRREMQEQQLAEALSVVEELFRQNPKRRHIVVAKAEWQIGLVGILAARIKDLYNIPTIVIGCDGDGMGRGSGRSVEGFDLGEAIMAAHGAGILLGGGGHAQAAGLSMDLAKVPELDEFLESYIASKGLQVCRDLRVDLSLSLGALRKDLWKELDLLEPFGSGHAVPIVLFSCVRTGHVKVLDGGHVSCRLYGSDGSSVRGIVFGGACGGGGGLGEALMDSRGNDEFDIVGRMSPPFGDSNFGSVIIEDMVKL